MTALHCNDSHRMFRRADFAYIELPTLSQAYPVARARRRAIVRRNRLIEAR
jgi:hypothetical protein